MPRTLASQAGLTRHRRPSRFWRLAVLPALLLAAFWTLGLADRKSVV